MITRQPRGIWMPAAALPPRWLLPLLLFLFSSSPSQLLSNCYLNLVFVAISHPRGWICDVGISIFSIFIILTLLSRPLRLKQVPRGYALTRQHIHCDLFLLFLLIILLSPVKSQLSYKEKTATRPKEIILSCHS